MAHLYFSSRPLYARAHPLEQAQNGAALVSSTMPGCSRNPGHNRARHSVRRRNQKPDHSMSTEAGVGSRQAMEGCPETADG